jgi:hypothetical protein
MKRMRGLPSYLQRWFDKKTRRTQLRFRRRGYKSVPLRGPIGSAEFWIDYQAALTNVSVRSNPGAELRSLAGSISAALAAYYGSHDWAGLSQGTRSMRRTILEKFRERYGTWRLRQITENFVEAYINALKPHAARNHLKTLRGFLKHAKYDVTRNIKAPKAKSTKHPSWPVEVMAEYEATHPIGSKRLLDRTNQDHSGNPKCQTTNPDLTLPIAKPLKDQANG